jgi:hypothetical protein
LKAERRALSACLLDLKLDSDNFIEAFDDMRKLFGCRAAKPRAYAFNGKGANLADFDPGRLSQFWRLEFMRERKTGTLRLAGQRHCYDGTGAIIEYIVTKYEDRAQTSLFATANRVKVGPTNFAPQYSGHDSSS